MCWGLSAKFFLSCWSFRCFRNYRFKGLIVILLAHMNYSNSKRWRVDIGSELWRKMQKCVTITPSAALRDEPVSTFNVEHLFSARFAWTRFPLFILKCPGVFFFVCVCLTVLKQCLNWEVFLMVSAIHIQICMEFKVTEYSLALFWKPVFGIQLLHCGALHSTVATMTVIRAWLLTSYLSTCDGLQLISSYETDKNVL